MGKIATLLDSFINDSFIKSQIFERNGDKPRSHHLVHHHELSEPLTQMHLFLLVNACLLQSQRRALDDGGRCEQISDTASLLYP